MNANFEAPVPLACPDDLDALTAKGEGLECQACGRLFRSERGYCDLLPLAALQETSSEGTQLKAYRASLSNLPMSKLTRTLGTLLTLSGNRYLYKWAARSVARNFQDKTATILDAGCGTGIIRRYLHKRHRYAGMDFTARSLERAATYYPGSYFRADLRHLPFPTGAFDAVVSLQSLQYLDNPQTALAQMARVLRPAGKLFLTVPNDESLKYRLQGIPQIQLQRFNHETLPALLGQHFEILEQKTRGFWLPFPKIPIHVSGVYPARWALSWTVVAARC